jgi:hypothetical protein
MKAAYIMFIHLLEESQLKTGINLPLLIVILTVLIIALLISIRISKKNKLYIKPDKQEELGRTYKEKEVAS